MSAAGRLAIAGAALSVLTTTAGAQKPSATPAGTSVSGTVIERATRKPIGGVIVSLQPIPTASRATFSNFPQSNPVATGRFLGYVVSGADGRFTFFKVTPGAYAIETRTTGWIGRVWESANAEVTGDWFAITSGMRDIEVTVPMEPAPVVHGRVADENGEPMIGIPINAFIPNVYAWPDWGVTGFARTDDRGLFRFSLSPGEVAIRAHPSASANARSLIYPPVFFPAAPQLDQAQVFRLRPGDVHNADFRLVPLRALRVRGQVIGMQTFSNVRLTLAPAGEAAPMLGLDGVETTTTVGSDGRFEFRAVPTGRYVLRAIEPPKMPFGSHGPPPLKELPAEPTLSAEVALNLVDSDLSLTIQLVPGVRISGRVEFDGEPAPEALIQLKQNPILVERSDGLPVDLRGLFLDARTFTTIQIPRGQYVVRAMAPQGWVLRSILHEGKDISDDPFDVGGADLTNVVITFTNRRSFLSGAVTGAAEKRQRPWVIAFPSDRRWWQRHSKIPRRVALTQVGTAGTYQIQLHPGGYLVCAVGEPPHVLSPGVFENLARQAVHVWINEGDRQTQAVAWAAAPVRR